MSRCMLCYPFTGNMADFAVTLDGDRKELRVCRFCLEDLMLLGFNVTQTVRLAEPLKPRIVRFWFLDPVRNLLEVSCLFALGFIMKLRVLTRRVKMELISAEGDICSLLFPQERAQHACRLFLEHLKRHGGFTHRKLSMFAWDLQAGKIEKGFRYSRTWFYTNIRKALLTLDLIAIEQRFNDASEQDLAPERHRHRDVIEKYVPVRQPIPKLPPDGLNLPRLI